MSKHKKCHSCGSRNFSGDVYCKKCGGALYERNHLNEKKSAVALFNL